MKKSSLLLDLFTALNLLYWEFLMIWVLSVDSGCFSILALLDLTTASDSIDPPNPLVLFKKPSRNKIFCTLMVSVPFIWQKFFTPPGRLLDWRGPTHLWSSSEFLRVLCWAQCYFLYICLPFASIFGKHDIYFLCFADDFQMYLPLESSKSNSLLTLLVCLKDIKSWMSFCCGCPKTVE